MMHDIVKMQEDILSPLHNKLLHSYIDTLSKNNTQVAIYLINGIKLSGLIAQHDSSVILLRDSKSTTEQLIFKHAISTIVPKVSG